MKSLRELSGPAETRERQPTTILDQRALAVGVDQQSPAADTVLELTGAGEAENEPVLTHESLLNDRRLSENQEVVHNSFLTEESLAETSPINWPGNGRVREKSGRRPLKWEESMARITKAMEATENNIATTFSILRGHKASIIKQPMPSVRLEGRDTTRGQQLELLEISLLLEGVQRYFGYDFRDYAIGGLRKRLWNLTRAFGLDSISALQNRVLHDHDAWERFLSTITVNVTGMFKEPSSFLALREIIVPTLRDTPFFRVWHAGCATGEEVYADAIVLQEEGILSHARVYATDLNESSLKRARTGIFPLDEIEQHAEDYKLSGGTSQLEDYYTAKYDRAIFRSSLKENILFSQHNLVTDSSFNEFQIIFCRDVLPYFNNVLQHRVHKLLFDSLAPEGFLILGAGENLKYTPFESQFEKITGASGVFRKKSSRQSGHENDHEQVGKLEVNSNGHVSNGKDQNPRKRKRSKEK